MERVEQEPRQLTASPSPPTVLARNPIHRVQLDLEEADWKLGRVRILLLAPVDPLVAGRRGTDVSTELTSCRCWPHLRRPPHSPETMIDPAVFFPSEIVARIAEFVADEPPTDRLPILLALSSSSRSWHYAVQGPLYHSVRLRSGQRTLKFVSSISVDSNRAACVRAVSLVPDANSLSETIALLCKNIKAVEYRDEGSIDMFPYMRPDPVFPFLCA